MIGENDKSMLERFKEWLEADFVLPKIKFTRKSKIKISELKEEIPIIPPLSKILAEPKIEMSDGLQGCLEALDNGLPIYSINRYYPEAARRALENTFCKCGRTEDDIKVLYEGWEGGLYVIQAVDRNTSSITRSVS